ncbi:unnamed protein product [Caenorhabditis auriculariae]|uniref:Uncharacterized protein n=1 Tax=Caenorhabditis auriculariae TaxID=2777116 RepID=A0A8S1HN61_9PELO|nr:unnamed protein product [Caenorhabditis auriculariae]
MTDEPWLKLGQLQPNMQSINTMVIILEPGQIRRTNTGTILVMRVADSTGSINLTLINPEFNETWRSGDILRIKSAYANLYQGGLTLTCGRNSECIKAGEFFMAFIETPFISEQAWPNAAEKPRPSFAEGDGNDRRPSMHSQNRKPPGPPNAPGHRPGNFNAGRGRYTNAQ